MRRSLRADLLADHDVAKRAQRLSSLYAVLIVLGPVVYGEAPIHALLPLRHILIFYGFGHKLTPKSILDFPKVD